MPSTKIRSSVLKKGILSSRLHIRPLTLSDHNSWKFVYQNIHPARNPWDESPWQDKYLTKTEYQKYLAAITSEWKKDQVYQFGIFLKNSKELIGLIKVSGVQRGLFQNGYIGYRIFNLYWQNQFGSEAVSAFAPWFLANSGLHRLEAGISIDNKSSLNMIKKTPFNKEGLSKKRLFVNGRWTDHWIFSFIKEN